MTAGGTAYGRRDGGPAQALPLSTELQALKLSAQLAARLTRPIGHFDASACALPPLTSASVAAISAHPAFRRPLNRAVAKTLLAHSADVGPACIARLRTSPRTRLAALLVSQPMPLLREAAMRLAAAILHRRIVGLVLKTDRERVRAAFGEAAFLVATQEAPMLHAPLSEVEIAPFQPSILLGPDIETIRERLIGIGLSAFVGFIARAEPALGALFERRLPSAEDRRQPALAENHCDHIVRLLRRRMDPWSPIIA